MRSFSFVLDQVPIFNALIPILKQRGYHLLHCFENLDPRIIERGITIRADRGGNIGVAYFTEFHPEFKRLDDLLVALDSDDPSSHSLAQEAVLELELAIHPDALEALLNKIPELKTFLEETKSQQKVLTSNDNFILSPRR